MICSLSPVNLFLYIQKLLQLHFPDNKSLDFDRSSVEKALSRIEYCHSHIKLKYFNQSGFPVFNHLHGDHMAAFLWFLSNTLYDENNDNLTAFKISYLNKIMHGIDLFCSVSMPDIFLLVHPVGTVLGNASYSDFLVVYQGCTIGSNGSEYPTIGKYNTFYSRSSLIGSCKTGDNVVFGASSSIINLAVPSNSLVVGAYPSNRVLPRPYLQSSHIFV